VVQVQPTYPEEVVELDESLDQERWHRGSKPPALSEDGRLLISGKSAVVPAGEFLPAGQIKILETM